MNPSRCAGVERWCENIKACSVQGVCSAVLTQLSTIGSTTSASTPSAGRPAAKAAPTMVDISPPSITILGNGTSAVTATGAVLMLDRATWNTKWRDPGVTAHDDVDGDVTARISSFGAGGCTATTVRGRMGPDEAQADHNHALRPHFATKSIEPFVLTANHKGDHGVHRQGKCHENGDLGRLAILNVAAACQVTCH